MAKDGEMYYCGNCRREQEPSRGERCVVCRGVTVSWWPNKESSSKAMERWRVIKQRTG